MSSVFISYARKDFDDFVRQFRQDLINAGFNVWIDQQNLRGGTQDWETAIRQAIARAQIVVLIASPESRQSTYVRDEVSVAVQLENKPVLPIWAKGEEGRYYDCIPLGFGFVQHIDMRGSRYPVGLQDAIAVLHDIMGAADDDDEDEPSPAQAHISTAEAPLVVSGSPYKGLQAFTEADRALFFGRERLTAELVARLKQTADALPRFLAVIGASGSGKSSLVMAGALPALREDGSFIVLPRITPGARPLAALRRTLAPHLPGRTNAQIRDELADPQAEGLAFLAEEIATPQQGRVLLFIDQFEELFTQTSDEAERAHFIDLLVNAATDRDGVLVALPTLRSDFFQYPSGYGERLSRLFQNILNVPPMSLAELTDAVTRPAERAGLRFAPGLAGEIVSAMRADRDALAGALPLLQFTLARLYEERHADTLTRAAYDRIGGVQGAVGTHAETVFNQVDNEARQALERVFPALVNVDERGTPTRRIVEYNTLAAEDPAAARLIAALVEHRLLVADRADREDGERATVQIAHEALLTTWPRLVAMIARHHDDLRLIAEVRREAHNWQASGRAYKPWEHERLAPVYRAQVRFPDRFDAVMNAFIQPESDRLLAQFRDADEDFERLSIIKRWTEIGEAARPSLIAAIPHCTGGVNDEPLAQIVAALRPYDDDVIEGVRAMLQSDRWHTRRKAAAALGLIGDPVAVPSLVALLDDYSYDVRRTAADALGEIGHPDGLMPLIEVLQGDSDNSVQRSAAIALGKFADERAVPALTEALDAYDKYVRGEATRSLGLIGGAVVTDALLRALEDRDDVVRRRAALALLTADPDRARPALVRALDDLDNGVKRNALDTLGEIGTAAEVPAIIPLMDSRDRNVQRATVSALGHIGHPDALPALAAIVHKDDRYLRRRAAVALGNIADPAVLPLLIGLLGDKDAGVRRRAASALGKVADPDATPQLLDALEDRDAGVRRNAAKALGRLGDAAAVSPLVAALHDRDPGVRQSAADALGELRAVQAADALFERLSDVMEALSVHRSVARALGHIRQPEVIVRLKQVLTTTNQPLVRAIIAHSLYHYKEMDGTVACQMVIPTIQYEMYWVRRDAAEALGEIGGAPVVAHLVRALEDPSEDVQREAANALGRVDLPQARAALESWWATHPGQAVRWRRWSERLSREDQREAERRTLYQQRKASGLQS